MFENRILVSDGDDGNGVLEEPVFKLTYLFTIVTCKPLFSYDNPNYRILLERFKINELEIIDNTIIKGKRQYVLHSEKVDYYISNMKWFKRNDNLHRACESLALALMKPDNNGEEVVEGFWDLLHDGLTGF